MIFIITVVRYSHRMDDVEYMNLLLPLLKRILRKDDSAWSELLKMLDADGEEQDAEDRDDDADYQ